MLVHVEPRAEIPELGSDSLGDALSDHVGKDESLFLVEAHSVLNQLADAVLILFLAHVLPVRLATQVDGQLFFLFGHYGNPLWDST